MSLPLPTPISDVYTDKHSAVEFAGWILLAHAVFYKDKRLEEAQNRIKVEQQKYQDISTHALKLLDVCEEAKRAMSTVESQLESQDKILLQKQMEIYQLKAHIKKLQKKIDAKL